MIVYTPISLGELIDKISILQVKKKNIKNFEKQKLVNEELKLLNETLNKIIDNNKDLNKYLNQLVVINTKLWIIEDDIRECERQIY